MKYSKRDTTGRKGLELNLAPLYSVSSTYNGTPSLDSSRGFAGVFGCLWLPWGDHPEHSDELSKIELGLFHVECVMRRVPAKREFSQIGNVDVGVNVDVESHPVGPSTPWINILSDSKQIIQHYFTKKCKEIFKIK